MALPHALAAKLGKTIRLLASNSRGEAFAALCAIARLLESHGYSFHTLADHVENANGSGLSDADKQRIRSEIENAHAIGYAEGALEWREVALFIQSNKHEIRKLTDWDNEFIDDMASRTALPNYEPSGKQHQQLHRLFYKLGGKIT